MAGVNKVILLGNLGRDPEIRALESGVKVANFTLATTEYFKNKDGERGERTEWHRVVLWRRNAELAEQYLNKGSQVYVEGRLETREWEDKDGIKRYTTEVVGQIINFLGGKPTEEKKDPTPTEANTPPPNEEDDLPF